MKYLIFIFLSDLIWSDTYDSMIGQFKGILLDISDVIGYKLF